MQANGAVSDFLVKSYAMPTGIDKVTSNAVASAFQRVRGLRNPKEQFNPFGDLQRVLNTLPSNNGLDSLLCRAAYNQLLKSEISNESFNIARKNLSYCENMPGETGIQNRLLLASVFSSRQLIDQALELLLRETSRIDQSPQFLKYNSLRGNLMLQKGYRSSDSLLKKEGKKILVEALAKAELGRHLRIAAEVQSALATSYWIDSDYGEAERLLAKSINNYSALSDFGSASDPLNNLALLQLWTGRPFDALDSISRAVEFDRVYLNGKDAAVLSYNLARIYKSIGWNKLALAHCEQAQSGLERQGNIYAFSLATNLCGLVQRELGNFEEAIQLHHRAIEYFLSTYETQAEKILLTWSSTKVDLARSRLLMGNVAQASRDSDVLDGIIQSKETQKFTPELIKLLAFKSRRWHCYRGEVDRFEDYISEARGHLDTSEDPKKNALSKLNIYNLELDFLSGTRRYEDMLRSCR